MANPSYEFYSARAAESAAEAKAATLDNVRERALRSKATWQALADQARAVVQQREKIETAKAAARAAERDAGDS
ncbi:hypothetical protein [Qipengyuania qiaonensis]|uniref:Uncharacterized protein n=1 Tax=Qipengyuania qiaonensis TaxID=2867240 RepID=A0ABS7JDB4_9SPHN|nr:hypothetical protein [Qipengyuania qiaonensis]MBX7483688.1 hypothetical protein [Qipengyuania qiaonensis]